MDEGADLPVTECLAEVIAAVAASQVVVLKAPPGAGKTTGVPPALIHAGIAKTGRILLIQPRRMAARAAAHRLSVLGGTQLGSEVGYHVRFDKCFQQQTKLIAMTTGILLRRLSSDPLLDDVDCVILDEFHERSVEMDLALGMLQRIRTTLRPELKLIIMSATLDPKPIVEFLGQAVAIESQGRSFPVDIRYSPTVTRDPVDQQIAAALRDVMQMSPGHVLVFLPGVGEIRRVHRELQSQGFDRDATILELYGDLPPVDQDAVLQETSHRKIILSTNVAETSVTIPGVSAVIDTGTARVMQSDPRVGLPKLQLESISRAAADQRAGRAGRTSRGVCLRLWPSGLDRSRRPTDLPEIRRCDFSGPLLTLAGWGERDVFAFPWLTPPPSESVDHARTLLQRLDAMDEEGCITDLGRLMISLPLPPRLARMMIEAVHWDVQEEAAIAASLLSQRDPFRDAPVSESTASHPCDLWDRVERLIAFSAGDKSTVFNRNVARQIMRASKQIQREVASLRHQSALLPASTPRASTLPGATSSTSDPPVDRFKRVLLAAFPDRLAKRRQSGSDRGVMVGGRGVCLAKGSMVKSGDLFLCIDIDAKGTEATVRMASSIDSSWIDSQHIRQVDEPFFDATLGSVVARRRRYFYDLVLSEAPIRCEPGPEAAQILAAEASKDLSRVLPKKDGPLFEFINRVRFLRRHMPQLELSPLDDEAIREVLESLCQSRTSFAELSSAPWLDHLRGRYDYQQLKLIEQNAPSRILVPSGNEIAIRYGEDKPPMMEVRIQELFGWPETPRVAGGRVPIQLHLLGPNYRPQQITEDLANFWAQTYSQVRKELRRRYPKHHWPEDPTTAAPTRSGLKPRP